jgi:hypothetical protein
MNTSIYFLAEAATINVAHSPPVRCEKCGRGHGRHKRRFQSHYMAKGSVGTGGFIVLCRRYFGDGYWLEDFRLKNPGLSLA